MNKDNAKEWPSASAINDPLTDLLKAGAKALIQQAVEAELHAFLSDYDKVTDLRGRQSVVRNGYLPEREIVTGVGKVTVKTPKVRDRAGGGIKFNSSLVPPNVPLYTVSKVLRHSTVKMTEKYAHLNPDNLRDAVCVLEKMSRFGHVPPKIRSDEIV